MNTRALLWCAVSTVEQTTDDKHSLPSQEADAVAFCEKNNFTIVDILRVPGHSRNYRSLDKLAADARAVGIDAFDQLITHLNNADFDVLIVRDANRFARKASLLHYIVECVIEDCGAKIYSFNDGWIDATNADIFAMVKGYTTAKERKWLTEQRAAGMRHRFERNEPLGKLPLSHIAVRDGRGKMITAALNPAYVHLWPDVAAVLLDGVSWTFAGDELYQRYGHVQMSNGKRWNGSHLRNIVLNPMFHGHAAKNHNNGKDGRRLGVWCFDPTYPPPDGVEVHYNVYPAALTGELAHALQNELRRRTTIVSGRARSTVTNMFCGLVCCKLCGYRMTHQPVTGYSYYRCESPRLHRCNCTAVKRAIPLRALQDWWTPYIEAILRYGADAAPSAAPTNTEAVSALKHTIATLEQRADGLFLQIADAPLNLRERLQRLLTDTADQLAQATSRLHALEAETHRQAASRAQQASAAHAVQKSRNVEQFWQQSPDAINRVLFGLLDGRVMMVENGVVTGLETPPRFQDYQHTRSLRQR